MTDSFDELRLHRLKHRPTSRRGRRPRQAEALSVEVQTLLEVVRTATPAHVQRFFQKQTALLIDDELEALATWIQSEWDPNVDTDHVKALLTSGQPRRAINAIIAQMRREFVEELRRHMRAEADDNIDQCVEEV